MHISRWARTVAVALVVAGATTVAASAPASAALPVCNAADWVSDIKGHGQFGREFRRYQPLRNDVVHFNQCYLAVGTRGEAVRALQVALNACYSRGLVADGIYGTKTRDALAAVQRSLGRTADGQFGPDTEYWMRFPDYWSSDGTFAGCESSWERR
jgi:hypothetical protein